MNQRLVSDLKGCAAVRAVDSPNKKELLLTVARMFSKRQDEPFTALANVEFKQPNVIRTYSTDATALEPVVALLNDLDIPTEPNALAVRTNLYLTDQEFHNLVCACNGRILSGSVLRERFERLALKY